MISCIGAFGWFSPKEPEVCPRPYEDSWDVTSFLQDGGWEEICRFRYISSKPNRKSAGCLKSNIKSSNSLPASCDDRYLRTLSCRLLQTLRVQFNSRKASFGPFGFGCIQKLCVPVLTVESVESHYRTGLLVLWFTRSSVSHLGGLGFWDKIKKSLNKFSTFCWLEFGNLLETCSLLLQGNRWHSFPHSLEMTDEFKT
jgi:hypothetical protein